jgi:hypothetical protein
MPCSFNRQMASTVDSCRPLRLEVRNLVSPNPSYWEKSGDFGEVFASVRGFSDRSLTYSFLFTNKQSKHQKCWRILVK